MKRLSFLVFFLFLLISCKKTKEQYETYTNLQPLRLGIMQTMDCLPFIIAHEKGFYDSLGLELSIAIQPSVNERNTALQSGHTDGAIIDYTEAIRLHANGTPIGIVMKTNNDLHLIAGKHSHIHSLQELKGKNIAVSRNTATEYTADLLLTKVGILPEEVNKPEISNISLRTTMLQHGQIDAAILPEPFATIAIYNGGHPLTTKELSSSVTGAVFNLKALQEKRREIEVLFRGYNWGIAYLKKYPASEWKDILIREIKIPESVIGQIQLPQYKEAGLPSPKDIAPVITWLKNKKLIPELYNGENLIDTIKGIRIK